MLESLKQTEEEDIGPLDEAVMPSAGGLLAGEGIICNDLPRAGPT